MSKSIIASAEAVIQKEIQKKNCLIFIVKDCNLFYSINEITIALKQFIADKNVIKTFFKSRDVERDQHVGIYNLEVLNPIIYKQNVKTSAKIF